ncbi:MAG: iron ABC transporter permease [Candidatus Omnitrophica bacterium CG02_land_8_20_14_3_00__42_8]|nr:MAG: iron ABC transporter permease [Candidatus Omnitrophica bacterium CG02_land_8_20_14_3_00__42_8]PIW68384.1 MAG: iron ABC transporter permease [Candidatus Omnitrophica bacterium CG12_big_fil_rev_8_21_14_0_65_42_8]
MSVCQLEVYAMGKINQGKVLIVLFFCLIIGLFILNIFIGTVNISANRILEPAFFEILKLRLLRALLAISAGACLSLAGVILQAVLRNPLAEPYVLGVSSGAGLGAVIGLLFISLSIGVSVAAFIGGIITIFLVYKLAKIEGRMSPENMIIAGIIVNGFLSSILMFFVSNSSSENIHSVVWWLLGNLQVYKIAPVLTLALVSCAGVLISYMFSRELNAISLGEEEAMHLGIDIEKVKITLLLVATLITSLTVSICGIIGFAGLMMPHIARRLVGPDHRMLLPASVLMGAAFLLLCDIFSKTMLAPKEIPIGVITSFIGVPFFIYVLKKSRKAYFR